ncbi:MAG: enoyl-CoA hydratase/isomerase family protein [Desulfobacterium sp.]|nr:enoyl-CoA hydratase/isomerase family protein [Desulfobacteraceae bacterium]MBA3038022.1 enoyl-CoA hydratase/isomerase family protein [Desulfobacterium sp.]MBU4038062.1 enoyl-CoA hydratase/isomerase family protein [Pseudomonadota bacterium]
MNPFETLIYEKKGPVARVILNRPEVLNVHNMAMRDDLFEVLSGIREDDDVRVVVFKGSGEKAFCAGADLNEFLTAPPPAAARDVRFDADLWDLFTHMPQPLMAAVHGYCLGSGIEITLCCDLVIASEDARFGLPEMGLGIIPAAGGTQTVPRAIGNSLALEMILINRWVDADEARRIGMVNRVVPKDRLWTEAEETASQIAAFDAALVRSVKAAVLRGMDLSLDQGLEMERRLALRLNRE